MISLREKLGTKYLTEDTKSSLLSLFESIFDTAEIVDIESCKFNPECEKILRRYYGKIKFVNTSSKELNDILEHNEEAASIESPVTEALPITLVTQEEILNFFKGLDKSLIYDLSNFKVNSLKSISIAILVIMRNPEVMVDLGNYADSVFNQVRMDWLRFRKPHSSYKEVIGNAIVVRQVVDGRVYIPGVGDVEENIYISDYTVLPTTFGSVKLNLDEEFREVWSNTVKNLSESSDTVNTMKSYIEVGED